MLILSDILDTVPISPSQFSLPTHVAITEHLNRKYANKILQNVGFCMAVWDLIECGDGKVRWGDGAVWYKVKFALLVFQPFVGEVLLGKVVSSTADRIRVSLGFFDDIYILRSLLPADEFIYDPEEPEQPTGAFHWLVPADEEDPEAERTRLPILDGDMVRVRITHSLFQEHEPGPPRERQRLLDQGLEPEILPGYILEATIAEQGLGCVEWWPSADPEEGDGEEGGMAVDS